MASGRDDLEIVEVPLANGADAMSVVNGTSVNVRHFSVSDHPQTDSFLRIGQI